MTYATTYFDKDKTKFSHELCQILDEVTHGGPAFSGLWKLRPNVVGSVCPLACSKLGFSFISERDSNSLALDLLLSRILRWSSQWSSHYLNLLFFENPSVLAVEIYLVAKESLWLTAKPFLIFLYVNSQVRRFVICIPAVMIYKGVAADDTDANLCTELHLGFGFASYNGTDMRLMDTDNAVFARVLTLAQHLLLLVIHVDDGLYGPLLCTVESAVCLVIHSDEIEKREYVAVKQRKHACESILDQFRTLVFALYDIEIDCPYAVALHSGRFAYLFNTADFVYHAVNVFRAILNQINIRRISYLRIGTCRIRLDISRLCLVSRDTVSAFVIAAVFFCLPFP